MSKLLKDVDSERYKSLGFNAQFDVLYSLITTVWNEQNLGYYTRKMSPKDISENFQKIFKP